MVRRHLELVYQKLRALLGDRYVCHHLGALYATGGYDDWPALKSHRKAVAWYRRGARLGDAESEYDLGFMVILGEGTPQNREAGVGLMRRAAAHGHCEAIRFLADGFATGAFGVTPDPVQAEYWSRALADHLIAHPEHRRLHEMSDDERAQEDLSR